MNIEYDEDGDRLASAELTLRDYLAAKADIGNVDELTVEGGAEALGRICPDWRRGEIVACLTWWADYRSKLRYIEADAMLKARKQ